MNAKWTRFALFLIILMHCTFGFAVRSLKIEIPKSQAIVIKVPPSQWVQKETSWDGKVPISVLRVDQDFLKDGKWENGTLPLLTEFHIEKAQDCGGGNVMAARIVGCPTHWSQIELRSANAWLKIQFPPEVGDVEAALKQIAFIGTVAEFEATTYLHDRVFMRHQASLFAALPDLDESARYAFFLRGAVKGFDVSSARFKETGYVQFLIPATTTFNTARVEQNERVARVIRETVIPEARAALPLCEGRPVAGLSFHLSIPAHNFVTGGEARFDDLLVYIKTSELKALDASDITTQKLIDGSYVILNGDRVDVKL